MNRKDEMNPKGVIERMSKRMNGRIEKTERMG
jgi:hypothetical protein